MLFYLSFKIDTYFIAVATSNFELSVDLYGFLQCVYLINSITRYFSNGSKLLVSVINRILVLHINDLLENNNK